MQPAPRNITHVSDTALMTAASRALETERPDGLVHDPFARSLAGERGMEMARTFPNFDRMCFGVGVRSGIMDELVLNSVPAYNLAMVLNLGAGLDTRPWRLALPHSLRWVEVDFPGILDYKESVLGTAAPLCQRERLTADVTTPEGRERIAAAASRPALVITEGLLMYLPGAAVEALAAMRAFDYWMLDVSSAAMVDRVGRDTYSPFQGVRAPDCLEGIAVYEALRKHGWETVQHFEYGKSAFKLRPARVLSLIEQARTAGRQMEPLPEGDPSGIHLLRRAR